MDVIELLSKKGSEIADTATDVIIGSHLRHYGNTDPAQTRERVKILCDLTLECLVRKSTMPMIKYAEKIAKQRFATGFSLREVQIAFNVLEETIWDQIQNEMQPSEYADAVMRVNTPLRTGKESIARMYLWFVSEKKVPSLDILHDLVRTESSDAGARRPKV